MTYRSILLSLLLIGAVASDAEARTFTIVSVGTSFSPAALTIQRGDTVVFSLASVHNAVEVSQSTWNADGNTGNGGFTLPFGGGMVVFTEIGTHYYVCQPHAAFGMKGTITVEQISTGIEPVSLAADPMITGLWPNPVHPAVDAQFTVTFTAPGGDAQLSVHNIIGQRIALLYASRNQGTGLTTLSFDASKLPVGVHILRLESGDHIVQRRLVVVR